MSWKLNKKKRKTKKELFGSFLKPKKGKAGMGRPILNRTDSQRGGARYKKYY